VESPATDGLGQWLKFLQLLFTTAVQPNPVSIGILLLGSALLLCNCNIVAASAPPCAISTCN
jgi:hypothetical protein